MRWVSSGGMGEGSLSLRWMLLPRGGVEGEGERKRLTKGAVDEREEVRTSRSDRRLEAS